MDLFSDIPKKEIKALSVTQLVRKMKRAIEAGVGKLWIEGEVSNLKKQGSGHWYFSLKDEGSQIQCAMFNARRKEGSETLEDGSKSRIFADATVYEARGQLQVIVEKAERSGQGDLQARFDALKRKLHSEGLFDQARKKSLPVFPRTIGIVTSPTGAAIQDILNVLRRRAPWVQPVLFPVRVQGKGSETEVANAVRKLNSPDDFDYPRCDLLIVGRGGGSIEDLWCFNEEVLARAISASVIPVISAVGHEIDFTIADFVADMRAPTPSAAAELAVPDAAELKAILENAERRITRSLTSSLREPSQRLDLLGDSLVQTTGSTIRSHQQAHRELTLRLKAMHPKNVLERRFEKLAELRRIFDQISGSRITDLSRRLERLHTMMRTLGPDSAFKRGFSITMDEDGKILRNTAEVETGTILHTKLIDGVVVSTVR